MQSGVRALQFGLVRHEVGGVLQVGGGVHDPLHDRPGQRREAGGVEAGAQPPERLLLDGVDHAVHRVSSCQR
ncbi:hypothetical protein DJ64_28835 [Streptomyces griseorubens]|uniref:Uncharacterized protein n=1 Tax=Streptomyces griseorubens TaxID=66897 RepID=A0ABR4T6D8_9ACTN|nr:hypothetical protein DJ64_28835 [Streptomyces griseorubens]